MKIQIINRRALLKSFNEENCTTVSCSKYVGAEVQTNLNNPLAISFRHTNGSGWKTLTFEPSEAGSFVGKVVCTEEGFSETCEHLRWV